MRTKYTLLLVFMFAVTSLSAQKTSRADADSSARHLPTPGYNYKQYLADNLHYPEEARMNDVQGRVMVKFFVSEDGTISDCSIVNSVNAELDAEALRVVSSMPPWQPAMQNGKAVKAYFKLPVVFKLDGDRHSRDSADKMTFTYVEQMPVSGYDFQKYLAENIHYPDSAIAHNIEGRVVIKFIVSEDGSIIDCKVVKGVSEELDAEALRVVRSFPKWIPGRQNGKAVKVYFTLPIVFKLEDDK